MSIQENEIDLERTLVNLSSAYTVNPQLVGITFPISIETKNNISYEIENIYRKSKCETYLEAITLLMDLYDYDYSNVNKILSNTMMDKLSNECLKNGSLKASVNELKCYDITSWS